MCLPHMQEPVPGSYVYVGIDIAVWGTYVVTKTQVSTFPGLSQGVSSCSFISVVAGRFGAQQDPGPWASRPLGQSSHGLSLGECTMRAIAVVALLWSLQGDRVSLDAKRVSGRLRSAKDWQFLEKFCFDNTGLTPWIQASFTPLEMLALVRPRATSPGRNPQAQARRTST